MGKPTKSEVWDCFTITSRGSKIIVQCSFCQVQFGAHATRMKIHVTETCTAVPDSVRIQLQDAPVTEVVQDQQRPGPSTSRAASIRVVPVTVYGRAIGNPTSRSEIPSSAPSRLEMARPGPSRRRRSNSDSMDCDDELAELMSRRRGSDEPDVRETDEDTEDASEDGDDETVRSTGMKEEMYFTKMAQLKAQLKQLERGEHPEYVRGAQKYTAIYEYRMLLNEVWKILMRNCLDQDFMNEKKAALREFEDKKVELKDGMIQELEEQRKLVEQDRYGIELNPDIAEVRIVSTRKLRRRPNEPAPVPEKRRPKAPQSQLTFNLSEMEVENDLAAILKKWKAGLLKGHGTQAGTSVTGEGSRSEASESPSPVPATTDIRIEDGKLFYEKRWFHRGQPVYIESKETGRIAAVISAISSDSVWIRKIADNVRSRILLLQLVKGNYSIKRRA